MNAARLRVASNFARRPDNIVARLGLRRAAAKWPRKNAAMTVRRQAEIARIAFPSFSTARAGHLLLRGWPINRFTNGDRPLCRRTTPYTPNHHCSTPTWHPPTSPLTELHFTNGSLITIRLDRDVRDYLLAAVTRQAEPTRWRISASRRPGPSKKIAPMVSPMRPLWTARGHCPWRRM
jgi:hypothetical protein